MSAAGRGVGVSRGLRWSSDLRPPCPAHHLDGRPLLPTHPPAHPALPPPTHPLTPQPPQVERGVWVPRAAVPAGPPAHRLLALDQGARRLPHQVLGAPPLGVAGGCCAWRAPAAAAAACRMLDREGGGSPAGRRGWPPTSSAPSCPCLPGSCAVRLMLAHTPPPPPALPLPLPPGGVRALHHAAPRLCALLRRALPRLLLVGRGCGGWGWGWAQRAGGVGSSGLAAAGCQQLHGQTPGCSCAESASPCSRVPLSCLPRPPARAPRPRRNKVQHLMHISLQHGFSFLVHPTAFVVHVPHKKPSTKWLTRKMGQARRWLPFGGWAGVRLLANAGCACWLRRVAVVAAAVPCPALTGPPSRCPAAEGEEPPAL